MAGTEPTERFERVRDDGGFPRGSRLCGRREVNPALSYQEALDDDRFLSRLKARLGEPDDVSDDRFSYCVRDRKTGVRFEAYSGESGPSYGGMPDLFDETPQGGYRLSDAAREVLAAFEAWIEAPPKG